MNSLGFQRLGNTAGQGVNQCLAVNGCLRVMPTWFYSSYHPVLSGHYILDNRALMMFDKFSIGFKSG